MSDIVYFYVLVAVLGFMLLALIISYCYVALKNRRYLSKTKPVEK